MSGKEVAKREQEKERNGDAGIAESQVVVTAQVNEWIAEVSARKWTAVQIEKLSEAINPKIVDIKTSGQVFVSHIHYRRKLDDVFGMGGWGIIPYDLVRGGGSFKIVGRTVNREYVLVVGKRFVGTTVGHCDYVPSNRQMSWADAAEGCESNAIMRLCKRLNMWLELWDQRWIKAFKKQHCIRVRRRAQNKPHWRRKDQEKFFDEIGEWEGAETSSEYEDGFSVDEEPESENSIPSNHVKDIFGRSGYITKDEAKRLFQVADQHKISREQIAAALRKLGLIGTHDIRSEHYEHWLAYARSESDMFTLKDKTGAKI